MNILRKNIFFGALLMGAATFQVSGLSTAQAMRGLTTEHKSSEEQSFKFSKSSRPSSSIYEEISSTEGEEKRTDGYESDGRTPDEVRATKIKSSKIESPATTRGDHVIVGGKPFKETIVEWGTAYGPRLLAASAVLGVSYLTYTWAFGADVMPEPGMLDSAMGALSNGFGSVWGTLFGGSAAEM